MFPPSIDVIANRTTLRTDLPRAVGYYDFRDSDLQSLLLHFGIHTGMAAVVAPLLDVLPIIQEGKSLHALADVKYARHLLSSFVRAPLRVISWGTAEPVGEQHEQTLAAFITASGALHPAREIAANDAGFTSLMNSLAINLGMAVTPEHIVIDRVAEADRMGRIPVSRSLRTRAWAMQHENSDTVWASVPQHLSLGSITEPTLHTFRWSTSGGVVVERVLVTPNQ